MKNLQEMDKTKTKRIYLEVMLDVEIPEDADEKYIDDYVISELDYEFKSSEDDSFKVVNTEIIERKLV